MNGTSLELKYQIWSPETHAVGLSLYFEPGYGTIKATSGARFQEIETEARIILQKNFLKGRLITACNFVIEPEWERTASEWEPELVLEWAGGASWRLNDCWRVGLESRVQTVFPDYKFNDAEFVTLHVGPTVLYSGHDWFASLTVLPQVAGWPDSRGKGGLHLDQKEQLEVRFKIGVEF